MPFGDRKKTSFHTKPRKQLKRATIKRKSTSKRSKPKKRDKLPSTKTMRNKCDKLLTPIIKHQYPYCYLQISDNCARETQVAHHHIKKSQSTAVRYHLQNLIPLCHSCHMKLHSQETTWASYLVEKKGLLWWKRVYAESTKSVKADVHFYIENYERLRKILEELENKV